MLQSRLRFDGIRKRRDVHRFGYPRDQTTRDSNALSVLPTASKSTQNWFRDNIQSGP